MLDHTQLVTASFPSYANAALTVKALEAAGYDQSSIAIITPQAHTGAASATDVDEHRADMDEDLAVEGAKEGIIVAAGTGVLTALAVAAFPAGLFLVGGWLAAAEIGVMFGMAGGLGAALVHAGSDVPQAEGHVAAVEAGHTLVSVRCTDAQLAEVRSILAETSMSASSVEVTA